jgi:hypothetical protein
MCNVLRCFFYLTLFHYVFRPKRPASGIQVVVFQDSAALCNAVFFLLLLSVVIFGYVGCTSLFLILFGLLVVAALSVLVGARVLLCAGRSS